MLNLLYVEDDANSRDVVRMAMRLSGVSFNLVAFEDSNDFEQRLAALDPQPEIILLDIHVKPYTGFELLTMIRSHAEYAALPVVALTASVMNEEVQLLQEVGFQGVISKPLNMEDFYGLLQRVLAGERVWYVW